MRQAFLETLQELAEQDSRIVFLTGDLGYTVVESFQQRFPNRFFNCGVAEQNMVGLATGLAEAGFLPFLYSIVTFAALRPYEFIRNGPVAQGLPVRIVAIGAGYDYGTAGFSHHGLEDAGVMRLQPGLTVIAPADDAQARAALRATWNDPGPVYFRLCKQAVPPLTELAGRFEVGRSFALRPGCDVVLVALGEMAAETLEASNLLAERGIAAGVVSVATLSPAPLSDLTEALAAAPAAVTVESHYIVGALGSLTAEIIAEKGLRCRLARCGARSRADGVTGGTAFLNHRAGLSAVRIAEAATHLIESVEAAP
jgi:transketolase